MSDTITSSMNNNVTNQLSSFNEGMATLKLEQCQSDFNHYISNYKANENITYSSLYPDATAIIKHYFALPTSLLIINSRQWLSATETVKEIIPSFLPAEYLLSYNKASLFGRLSIAENGQLQFSEGLLATINNGVLVLNISPLLVMPELWFMLKAVLQRGYLEANDAVNAEKIKQILPDLTQHKITTKIVLVASRSQVEELIQIDPEYSQLPSLFCELAEQILATQESINTIVNYCHKVCEELNIAPLDNAALSTLLNHLSVLTQHQKQILFSPELIKQIIQHANLFTDTGIVTSSDINAYYKEINQAQSLARKYSEQSIIEKQVNLQLGGEEIGQINGLSVVELLGYPCEFGEIFRISATDMIGDGEIIDVERKVELAGNIHAKSTLIVQGYLNHFFSHINAFPYSCNVVFEQSYQESDGDSASIAILLAVSSCYAKMPAKQNVFVTGALDQHGNVLAIGGINQKIESVTRLFELNLLNEPVTIVMPKANMINLTLNQPTLALIKSGKIIIQAISHCHQAYPTLLSKTFKEVLNEINIRVENASKEEIENETFNLFARIKNLFLAN